MSASFEEDLDQRRLVQRVDALRGRRCRLCEAALCDHALLINVLMGFQDEPNCTRCFAESLGAAPDASLRRLRAYVNHRECTRGAWDELSAREPGCPLGSMASEPRDAEAPAPRAEPGPDARASGETWDAGDLGCGDLVLELRGRLRDLPARAVLHLVARDPGAPADIPAWCRLTGHHLVSANHPDYYIRRKDA
jgi:tRNA 2-thiouridine synthesizing protein A